MKKSKLKFTLFCLGAQSLALLVALAVLVCTSKDTTTLILGIFTSMAGTVAFYFAANVVQNYQVSRYYNPALAEPQTGSGRQGLAG